jgi:hypothetical protein
VYEGGSRRLEEYVSENRELEKTSHLRGIIKMGKSMFGSYFMKEEKVKMTYMSLGKNDI